jgi:hypothetical protein
MPCAGTTPDVATAPDGMKLIDAANVAIYWNIGQARGWNWLEGASVWPSPD